MMKIGATTLALRDMTLDQILVLCKEAGYEAIELAFAPDKELNVNMSDAELDDVAARCRDANVEITSVFHSMPGSLLSLDAAERATCCRCIERVLEVGSRLEAGAMLLNPGALGPEGTYDEVWDTFRDTLTELAPRADALEMAIGLENVWNKFIISPREAVQFVDEVGSERVGIYLDLANMMAYGYPEHWIRALGSRIVRVHLKEFDRGKHAFVNLLEGDNDWPVLMSELRAVGYDNSILHECGGDYAAMVDLGERMRTIRSMG